MASITLGRAHPKRKDSIRKRARDLGWSQAELARRSGTTPAYLSLVLSGRAISAPAWARAWAAIEAEEAQRTAVSTREAV